MDEARWSELRRLFDLVADAAPEDPEAFLREHGARDASLIADVLDLLRQDARPDTPLDGSPPDLEHLAAGDGPEPSAGSHSQAPPAVDVSPYRLLEVIGRGGMGVVYTATRMDGGPDRTVALKLIHAGLDTEEILRRFSDEQRILASLEHPNIARLYDAGRAEDERPYLVMEYVAGVPIQRHCEIHRLDVAARIRLFLQVCEAVSFAHQGLVIHRDLKPSNILVTEDGVVKLLDFGIAKLLDSEEHRTRTGSRMMTPEYASPEQLRGDVLTTASDVYSLGVVLYELLTRSRPVEGWDAAMARAVRPDRASRLERPSERVTSGEADGDLPVSGAPGSLHEAGRLRWSRTLRGDLDQIVLKALASHPTDRYEDVGALADDLRAYLDGRPVSAQPPSVPYRLRKLVGRRRGSVAAGLVVLLSLAFGLAGFVWQARRVAEERDMAVAVSGFLEDLFRAPDPRTGSVRDTTRMVDFLAVAEERLRTGLEDQPRPKARLLLTMGIVYRNLARRDLAVPVLREAVDAHEEAYGGSHPDAVESRRLLGLSLAESGDLEAGVLEMERALETQIDLEGPNAPATARLHETIGRAYAIVRRNADALPWLERALQARRAQENPSIEALSSSLNLLGSVLAQEGRNAEAAPYLMEAADLFSAAAGDLPDGLRQADEGVIRGNLTQILINLERFEEAEVQARRAWALMDSVFVGPQPAKASHLGRMATVLSMRYPDDALRRTEADSLFRASVAMVRELPRQPGAVTFRLNAYGRGLRAWGELEAAEAVLGEAAREALLDFGPDHPTALVARADWGRALADVGRVDQGLEETGDALARIGRSTSPEAPLRLRIALDHARVLIAAERFGEAADLVDELTQATGGLPGDDPLLEALDEVASAIPD